MNKNFLSIIISFVVLGIFGFFNNVYAADFESINNRTYTLTSEIEYQVRESHKINNNSKNQLIATSNKEIFQIILLSGKESEMDNVLSTIKVTADGKDVDYDIEKKERSVSISVRYPREVKKGDFIEFIITYTNPALLEVTGALVDLYVPGFAEGFKFDKGDTQIKYNTYIKIHNSLQELNFVTPKESAVSADGEYIKYNFTQESLLGKTLWMQLGRVQYYQFKITQKAPATDTKNTGYLNEYYILLKSRLIQFKYYKTMKVI